MKNFCYIGIDGGGTTTRGVATDENGTVLCRAAEASINYCSVGMPDAVRALSRLAETLQTACGRRAAAIAIGSSALDERVRDEHYDAFLDALSTDRVLGAIPERTVKSDAFMALLAATGGKRGAVLISGTGVMGLAFDGQALHTVAGWGDVFGDAGSGYAIGLSGLCAALSFSDGLNRDGEALCSEMLSFYKLSSAAELISQVYAPGFDKSQIAAFSARVAALAEKKDPCSLAILDRAAEDLVRYAVRLGDFFENGSFVLGFYGSVLTKNDSIYTRVTRELKSRLPRAEICVPETPAEDAAALYSIRRTQK